VWVLAVTKTVTYVRYSFFYRNWTLFNCTANVVVCNCMSLLTCRWNSGLSYWNNV